MVSRRAYKPGFSYERAFEIMTMGDTRTDPKKHFDPEILKVFTTNYAVFVGIHKNLTDRLVVTNS